MRLPLYCQSEGQNKTGASTTPLSFVLAPESALGSLASVALSSAQVVFITPQTPQTVHHNKILFRVDSYVRQRYPFRVDINLRQRARQERHTFAHRRM